MTITTDSLEQIVSNCYSPENCTLLVVQLADRRFERKRDLGLLGLLRLLGLLGFLS